MIPCYEAGIRCNACPSGPRYSYIYALIPSCDAPNLRVFFFSFFFLATGQVCRDRIPLSFARPCRVLPRPGHVCDQRVVTACTDPIM